MGETAPFWRFSAASYPDLEDSRPVEGFVGDSIQSVNGNISTSTVCTSVLFHERFDETFFLQSC